MSREGVPSHGFAPTKLIKSISEAWQPNENQLWRQSMMFMAGVFCYADRRLAERDGFAIEFHEATWHHHFQIGECAKKNLSL
eukprot:2548103-Amphidinium_carterae.1